MNACSGEKSVASRFSSAAATYDRYAGVQRAVAERVVSLLRPLPPPSRVLEIGCGTGILTERLAAMLPNAAIRALDISAGMVGRARRRVSRGGRVTWIVGDARCLEGRGNFDLAVSGSALHWISPLEEIFRRAWMLTAEGGHLAFGMMVEGTLGELREARLTVSPRKKPRGKLPSTEEVLVSLGRAGYDLVRRERATLRAAYPSASDLLRCLHEQGVTGGGISSAGVTLNRSELDRLIAYYDGHYGTESGGVRATYELLYAVAERKGV